MPASPPTSFGVVAVGLADAIVLAGDPTRRALLISNPGPNAIWIAFGQPAVANGSLELPPNMPPLLLRRDDWPGLLAQDLHAITVTAAGKLAGLSLLDQTAS